MKYGFKLSLLLLALSVSTAFAEEQKKAANNQVYSKSSASTVEKLNKATDSLRNPGKILKKIAIGDDEEEQDEKSDAEEEILRDPTQMSGNFRQALKNVRPTTDGSTNGKDAGFPEMPDISLAAKIMGRKNTASVILKVNKRNFNISEGKSASFIDSKHRLIRIRVDEIRRNYVKIFVLPHGEELILQ